MVDAQTIGVLRARVTVAAIYYMFTLRSNNKTRQAQLFMNIYQTQSSPDFLGLTRKVFDMELRNVEDYNRLLKDPETYGTFYSVAMNLEGLGVLVKEGLIDIRMPSLLIGGLVQLWWEKFGEGILVCKRELGFPVT